MTKIEAVASSRSCDYGDPLWLGDEERPVLGWLHCNTALKRDAAIVLCPPFGHEYMVAYRGYRHLAAKLAKTGFYVLRFDYDGTGDSAGSGSDPGRIFHWHKNIAQAINKLRDVSDTKKVVLFGLRLGGLLAATMPNDQEIDALIMLAPLSSGRLFIRESNAFRNLNMGQEKPADHGDFEEVVGYPLSSETKRDLLNLDFRNLHTRPSRTALIISRDDDLGQESSICRNLERIGAATELVSLPGYKAYMTDDAHDSKVPDLIWDFIHDWLEKRYISTAYARAKSNEFTPKARFKYGDDFIVEEVLNIKGTVGILTEAKDTLHIKHKPMIIISNTGANHRVGNHRLCVSIARQLGMRGFRTIRYDRPGIGDSTQPPGSRENDVYSSSGLESLRAIMDFSQQRYGAERFILAGLCSGAYFSYHAAIKDHRAVGLLMINPLTYQWREGDAQIAPRRTLYKATNFYLRSILNLETWKRLLLGELDVRGIANALTKRLIEGASRKWQRSLARAVGKEDNLTEVARNFLRLESRGTDILMVFDSSEGGIDLIESHLGKKAILMRNRANFRIEYVEKADHTFTPLWAQEYLINLIANHWQERFG